MCKDISVYDFESFSILNIDLLPGILQVDCSAQNINAWCQGRYSQKSNSYARVQRAREYPHSSPEEIDRLSGAFSLSDCYWIQTKPGSSFRKLSPYFEDNWKDGISTANIYTNGWQSKRWVSPNWLYKYGSKNEMEIMRLARLAGLTSVEVKIEGDGILVENFTNTDIMFEPADMSALFYDDAEEDIPLPRVENVIEKLGIFGEQMLLFDNIVGNWDRHLGNFGFLRDSNTGKVLSAAPLFDFEHSEEQTLRRPEVMSIVRCCKNKPVLTDMCNRIYVNTDSYIYRTNCSAAIEMINGVG